MERKLKFNFFFKYSILYLSDKIKIQIITRTIAITALITDAINQLNSPNPEIEIGPKIVTTIPPPTIINPHIANKKVNNPDFKVIHPS